MQAQQIKTVIENVYKADTIQYHIKNYLPNLIVFSGNPESRKKLVSLAHLITKNNGVQMCVNVEKVSYLYLKMIKCVTYKYYIKIINTCIF